MEGPSMYSLARDRSRDFGVRRRRFGGDKDHIENSRDGGETAHFTKGKALAIGRRIQVPEFNFHSDSAPRAPSQPGKYVQDVRKTTKVTPGLAIKSTNEEEERLTKLPLPPTATTDFISKIQRSSTGRKMNVQSSNPVPRMAANTPSPSTKRPVGSLEAASAPSRAKVTSTLSREQWMPPKKLVRDPQSENEGASRTKRQRVSLTPTPPKRASPSSPTVTEKATRTSSRLTNRPARQTFGMYDLDNAPSNASVQRRRSTTILETRRPSTRSSRMPTEGSEAMPISLSDSESEDDSDKSLPIGVRTRHDADASANDDGDLSIIKIKREAVIVVQRCKAWFGIRACTLDLYLSDKCLWITSISGVDKDWPLCTTYKIPFQRIKKAKSYRLEADFGGSADSDELVERVMSRVSFLALQFLPSDSKNKSIWHEFYDPSTTDKKSPKAYFVVTAPEEEELKTAEDCIRGRVTIDQLHTKDEVEQFAMAMTANDAHGLFSNKAVDDGAKRARRRNRTSDDADSTQLTYPLPPCAIDVVTITRQDVMRLRPRQYLNDNIIDYFFKRLLIEDYAGNDIVQRNVLFLSSHFYSRLRAGRGENSKERLAAGYQNVSTWLSRSNLFKRCLVFVPINKDMHWSLAVIINPRCAGSELADDEDEDTDPQTTIALLDPLGGYHSKTPILRHLKSFLELEWDRVSREKGSEDEATKYRACTIRTLSVKAPLQDNGYDCGVFVLKYAQVILENFANLLSAEKKVPPAGFLLPRELVDDELKQLIPNDSFGPGHVSRMRVEVEELLAQDTSAYEAILAAK